MMMKTPKADHVIDQYEADLRVARRMRFLIRWALPIAIVLGCYLVQWLG
jgi:hypothetical protein